MSTVEYAREPQHWIIQFQGTELEESEFPVQQRYGHQEFRQYL